MYTSNAAYGQLHMVSHYVALAGLELVALLLQLPRMLTVGMHLHTKLLHSYGFIGSVRPSML